LASSSGPAAVAKFDAPGPRHHGHIARLKEVAHDKPRPLLERNRAFAATGAHTGLSMMPNQPIFVVTCLDPRVDPAAFLGLGLGDAPVVRNAGGRRTDAVIDDIAFISYLAGTVLGDGPLFEVAVIHHTNYGTGFLANPTFRAAFAARTGLDESALAAEAVINPDETVSADVERLLASPKVWSASRPPATSTTSIPDW
jgi:carbonic anhydrase